MPMITEYAVVDLAYDEKEDWGDQLTRFQLESLMDLREWQFRAALPVNASRAKAIFSRTVSRTDAEVAAILNPPAAPAAAGG